jgi:hypothetical protein
VLLSPEIIYPSGVLVLNVVRDRVDAYYWLNAINLTGVEEHGIYIRGFLRKMGDPVDSVSGNKMAVGEATDKPRNSPGICK